MMDSAILKLLHFAGLGLWLGYMPLRALVLVLAYRSAVPARRRLAALAVRMAWLQQLPGCLLVVVTGTLLSFHHPTTGRAMESWFLAKLSLLVLIFLAELAAIVGLGLLSRVVWHPDRGSSFDHASRRGLVTASVGSTVSFALSTAVVLVSVAKTVEPLALLFVVFLTVGAGVLFVLVAQRAAASVPEVLPHV